MFQRILSVLAAGAMLLLLPACYTSQIGHPGGNYFVNMGKSGFSSSGATVSVEDKEGEACAFNLFALVATGDASVTRAARNGGITKVITVSHVTKFNIGPYQEWCTVVTGR